MIDWRRWGARDSTDAGAQCFRMPAKKINSAGRLGGGEGVEWCSSLGRTAADWVALSPAEGVPPKISEHLSQKYAPPN